MRHAQPSIRARLRVTQEHLDYLDTLAQAGIMPMFSATPYVAAKFRVDDISARIILGVWMRTRDRQADYLGKPRPRRATSRRALSPNGRQEHAVS